MNKNTTQLILTVKYVFKWWNDNEGKSYILVSFAGSFTSTYARIRTVRTPAQTRKQMQLTVAIFALILHFETIGTHQSGHLKLRKTKLWLLDMYKQVLLLKL